MTTIFISSLITGLATERAVVKSAIEALGYTPSMAESWGAQSSTPQQACLAQVRSSAAVVFIFGPNYGAVQESGISATHEEFREAGDRPRLCFVMADMEPEPRQAEFLKESGDWVKGAFWQTFSSNEELARGVTRQLHDWGVQQAGVPVDATAMV